MLRSLQAGMIAALLAPANLALAAPKACILTATETLTSPRKPNIFTMKLDCGTSPEGEQDTAVAMVNNQQNTVDALGFVLGLGYEVEAATTMVSYTGNAVISTFTLVKPDSPEATPISHQPIMPMAPVGGSLEDLPEADEDEIDGEGAEEMDGEGAEEMEEEL